jgi:transposase
LIIALIVTTEGFPLAYDVLAGNTSDKVALSDFLKKIEVQYGKAQRIWVMDRGVPTEQTFEQMRACDPPAHYVVGTRRGRLTQHGQELLVLPLQAAREGVSVKLLPKKYERYVFTQSKDRVHKERAMQRQQVKALWKRFKEIKRDDLLKKLGTALHQYPKVQVRYTCKRRGTVRALHERVN